MTMTKNDAEIVRKLRLLVPVPHSNTFLNAAAAIERLSGELAEARERAEQAELFGRCSVAAGGDMVADIERLSAELAASRARERTVAEEEFLSLSIARYSNSLTTGVFGTGELSHSFGAWWESYKNLDAERQKKTI